MKKEREPPRINSRQAALSAVRANPGVRTGGGPGDLIARERLVTSRGVVTLEVMISSFLPGRRLRESRASTVSR